MISHFIWDHNWNENKATNQSISSVNVGKMKGTFRGLNEVGVPVFQLLQEDLEMEQVRVNSLTHMVVVVDEKSGDGATAALESKLQVRTHLRS